VFASVVVWRFADAYFPFVYGNPKLEQTEADCSFTLQKKLDIAASTKHFSADLKAKF
jgi:hypothetical protein